MLSDEYMRYDEEIGSAATKGQELLDTASPDWRDRVDVDVLFMDDIDQCLLTQAFGGYKAGLDYLGIDLGEEYGFDIPESIFDIDVQLEVYEMLNDEWKARIRAESAT